MMYLDLDELPSVFAGRRFWSLERPNLATFRRQDHIGDPASSLAETVRDLVEDQTGSRPSGAVRLLTHLSYCGYCFNPVSLYFCFESEAGQGATGERLHSVVAEVTNTPWKERHCYVLRVNSTIPDKKSSGLIEVLANSLTGDGTLSPKQGTGPTGKLTGKISLDFPKEFHVSPFMPMDVDYRWQLTPPGQRLVLHTENWRNGERYFDATLVMTRTPIETGSLARVLIRYPLMTGQVMVNIYWQAFWLWWKKVPYVPHPKNLPNGGARQES
jgi:uncharacterized protein